MILIYFIIAITVCGLILKSDRQKIFSLTLTFLAVQTLFLLHTVLNRDCVELGVFRYDSLGILFFGTMIPVSIAVFLHGKKYLDNETVKQLRIYHASFVFLCMSLTGAYFSDNVTLTWVLIEATTLTAALLIYHRRTPRALEAAWKYVFVCSIGILIAYLGILFLSIMLKNRHGGMSFDSLAAAIPYADPLYLKLAFVLVLTGYSCKMEFFPLYPIGIDANHAAPAPMSAFLSTALVNMGFVSVLRIYRLMSASPVFEWTQNVMFVAGMASLIVSAIYIAQVRHCKRLFAYSTVENMGLVLLILSVGKAGIPYAVFHMLMHSLIKSTAFLRLSEIGKTYKSYKLENIGGYLHFSKSGSTVLLLCLVGLTAIPPSALFISEMFVFTELSKNIPVLICLILTSCIILYFLCHKFLKMIYGQQPDSKIYSSDDRLLLFSQAVLLGLFFIMGICQPQWFMDMIYECMN
ncbi:MAG: hydrogenase 4 subunit F [Prevotellaceae bacterium]|jgi:hydrogenase-4 component F|nr:hydrogenase 4 subunit F [Prevotellaceae bacterium]